MITRLDIHNEAMLYPSYCKEVMRTGQHNFVNIYEKEKEYFQCTECGKIVKRKDTK